MVDLSDILSSTANVQVQAHWDPIADATYNLHQLTTRTVRSAQSKVSRTSEYEMETSTGTVQYETGVSA